jgi:hypothetical protein
MNSPTTQDEVKAQVKDYLLKEFLPGEDPDALEDSTALISGGVLDSPDGFGARRNGVGEDRSSDSVRVP